MDELIQLCKQQGINLEGVSKETLLEMEKHFKLGYEMAAEMDNEVDEVDKVDEVDEINKSVSREEFESLKNEVEELKRALKDLENK